MADRFRPAWWLTNAHLQTLWPSLFRRTRAPALRREKFELSDGDFIELDWTKAREDAPTVLLLHGLEGSRESHYIRGMLQSVESNGWCGLVMHFRGCGGSPNRHARTYHSGETGDLDEVVNALQTRSPDRKLVIIGYSLGGNVLLKWLGERGTDANVAGAVSVCTPLLLSEAAASLERGFSRLYQWWLIKHLRKRIRDKFRTLPSPIDLSELDAWRTFRLFDDNVTAPLHGFVDVDDYYERSSARQFLSAIQVPTLIIQAADDPFMNVSVLPAAEELSASTKLEVIPNGGHVGFVAGRYPMFARYWLDERISEFISTRV